ncbi:hypothetical protein NDU88_005161 [Pleurodeles waltl]|uniref:Uncharacterized protein n=1 Tax=Pleurodeles waltl TaxID=8319 RepID=A0AAV7QF80_PLEWA|nr:hypothetical protein NDU88_005161 [Pleurodeles waltl]
MGIREAGNGQSLRSREQAIKKLMLPLKTQCQRFICRPDNWRQEWAHPVPYCIGDHRCGTPVHLHRVSPSKASSACVRHNAPSTGPKASAGATQPGPPRKGSEV